MSDDATTMTTADSAHPCLSCGACCASFRVDFAVYEMQAMGGTVPDGLALDVNGSTCRMRGTEQVPIRCAALTGQVGQQVACSIYELRPAPCREDGPRPTMIRSRRSDSLSIDVMIRSSTLISISSVTNGAPPQL